MFNNSLQKIGLIVGFFFVVFSINIAIGIPIVAFRESYSGVCPSLTNAVIGLKKNKNKNKQTYSGVCQTPLWHFLYFFYFFIFFQLDFFQKIRAREKRPIVAFARRHYRPFFFSFSVGFF